VTASLLGVGLVFTFFRSYWIATMISILVMWLASEWVIKRKLIVFGVFTLGITVIAAIALAGVVNPGATNKLQGALTKRVMSMFSVNKTMQSSSLQDRVTENRLAWRGIQANPVFGIGVGNPIGTAVVTNPRNGADQHFVYRVWMHNSYLELWLIYGMLGIASFIWLSVAFLIRSFRLFQVAVRPEWKAIAIAACGAYVGFLQRSITQMHMTHDVHQILTVAILWGLIEAIWRLNAEERANSVGEPRMSRLDLPTPQVAATRAGGQLAES
jgi:O-antigen ligase